MPKSKITLVGAGPVGSLLAVYLAQRGHDVEIFERRPDMRHEQISAGRSINLAVSTRGLHALREIGLEKEILEQAIPMRGRMMHSVSGQLTFQPYGLNDSQCINSISRGGLNKSLMTYAEKTGRVRIHFNKNLRTLDLETMTMTFADSRAAADVVIGTDGSASAVRQALMTQPGRVCTEELLSYGYKELTIPAGKNGAFRLEKHALHIWPRGSFMLIALPNFDGSFTCTLFLPFNGPVSFEAIDSPALAEAFFKTNFPDAVPFLGDIAGAFFSNPTGQMVTVKCSPWHYQGKALLVGDAAHAIVPFFGQGMNCGFEDCSVLNTYLDNETDWERVFSEFSRRRKPDADAIADMAVENFTEMRDKVGDPRFLLEKSVEKILLDRFPGEYQSRYALVTFSRSPYRLAYDVGVISNEILSELCADLKRAEDVDLDRAQALIRQKLSPVLTG